MSITAELRNVPLCPNSARHSCELPPMRMLSPSSHPANVANDDGMLIDVDVFDWTSVSFSARPHAPAQ
jgi:hypothetical protein